MATKLFSTAILLLMGVMPSVQSLAGERAVVTTPHARVSLLSERPQPVPGEALWLGLRFELEPHWHVYWRNPGASGAAPVIRWSLPDGWEVGDIHWPVPKRIRVGPLTTYGYEDAVTFLVPVEVPAAPLVDHPLAVTAEADWLVCRVQCIPESGRFTLTFHGPDGGAADSVNNQDLFDLTRARWPEAVALAGRYRLDGGSLIIGTDMTGLGVVDPADIWFAAHRWGPVKASGAQHWDLTGSSLGLRVPVGDLPPAGDASLDGLLVVESQADGATPRRGYLMRLAPGLPAAVDRGSLGLATALVFAVLGGMVLNIMPCVLPVLGIKVLGFVREAGAARRRLALHGLTYAAGILVSFAVLALLMLTLRAGGASLGWGFQLQSPILVSLLAYLMLLVGLNLSGVFSVGDALMGVGESLASRRGLANTFVIGVLAAVVASPCTAPFMGAALGFAITRPAGEALAVFLALGAGFALPVVMLSLLPAWVRLIPRPGSWMKTLRQALAFPMYATAAWLLWVLSQQTHANAFGAALAGLVLLALAAWVYGQWVPQGWRRWLLGAAVTTLLALLIAPLGTPESPADPHEVDDRQAWSEPRVAALTAAGRPVFVNFTAAWCITCKVNERLALATENTRRLFASRSVAYLVADWTRRDPEIARQLERHGRSGVPLYLLYSPVAGEPRVLPQLLTEGIVAEFINAL